MSGDAQGRRHLAVAPDVPSSPADVYVQGVQRVVTADYRNITDGEGAEPWAEATARSTEELGRLFAVALNRPGQTPKS